MPIYTYRCESCGVQFERTQKFTDPQLTRCPECGKRTLRKVYTPVGVIFKGSGFYATDHRSPSGMGPRTHSEEKAAEDKTSSDAAPVKPSETKPTPPPTTDPKPSGS
jgi:putative FmdB family regulatory protein